MSSAGMSGLCEGAAGGGRFADARGLQRRILRELLDRVPPHPAAHGFRRGCSVLTHAAPHAGRALVLRLDLEDFFPSIGAPRVRALFGALGYPEEVAHLLACVCTNVAPVGRMTRPALSAYATHGDVRARHDAETRARTRHLPQGAPTSPAIANLCAYHLDVRLTALALRMGAFYTRYADDLVFCGDTAFRARSARFAALAAGIAGEEGFMVNHRKTRFASQAASQRVGGFVVNARPRAPRAAYDALRALLFNAARTGLEAQNRDRHARGVALVRRPGPRSEAAGAARGAPRGLITASTHAFRHPLTSEHVPAVLQSRATFCTSPRSQTRALLGG